ncbi:MAG TPA: DUF3592 domain-containing protein [Burkholderiales bacterium]|nr:DUF3592 domain-containing protein [Burkholderiales bacterium]
MSAPSYWQLAKNSVVLWVGVIFVPIGGIFIAIGIMTALEELAFAKRGRIAEAIVLDRSLQRADFDKNPSTRYLIRYRFTNAAGEGVEQMREVPLEEWERLEPGSALKVRFLPDTSDPARVSEASSWPAVATFSALGLILVAVGAPLIVIAVREILRQSRVWRTGTTVSAVVTAVAPSSTRINGVQQWEIRYAFTDTTGRRHEGRSNCMPQDEAKQWHRGDRGQARFDPHSAASSVWLDHSAPAQQVLSQNVPRQPG